VQPLLITPEIAARAKADQQGQAQWGEDTRGSAREHSPLPSETTTTNAAEQVEQLQGMFPDFDGDVLSSVLQACGDNMEAAVSQLLEMNGGPAAEAQQGPQIDSDEELAMLLFQQFAEDLESHLNEPIPPEIRSDPHKFEVFVREKLETALRQDNSSFAQQANRLFQSSAASESFAARGGKEGFLDRFKKMQLGGGSCAGGRGDDKGRPLLDQADS